MCRLVIPWTKQEMHTIQINCVMRLRGVFFHVILLLCFSQSNSTYKYLLHPYPERNIEEEQMLWIMILCLSGAILRTVVSVCQHNKIQPSVNGLDQHKDVVTISQESNVVSPLPRCLIALSVEKYHSLSPLFFCIWLVFFSVTPCCLHYIMKYCKLNIITVHRECMISFSAFCSRKCGPSSFMFIVCFSFAS